MNAYYNESNIRKEPIADRTATLLYNLIAFLTNTKTVNIFKVSVITLALFAFVATVGMVDNGTIGFFWGAVICGILSTLEISVIKSMTKKSSENN